MEPWEGKYYRLLEGCLGPGHDPLIKDTPRDVLTTDTTASFQNFLNSNGEWNYFKLGNVGITNLANIISNVDPPFAGAIDNEFLWGSSPDGGFSTKSAYAALLHPATSTIDNFYVFW